MRRAEAAEATVQTLQTHLSSLQQRLREAEEICRHSAQRLAASENELRRVKQQEYAEQQLRVEAERALAAALDRSSDGALARSEVVQRLQARVAEVERRAAHLAEEIESERRARERLERELEAMRESHAAMAVTVSELEGRRPQAARRRGFFSSSSSSLLLPPLPPPPLTGRSRQPASVPAATAQAPSQARREEMTDALVAAEERLRARAEETSPPPQAPEEASISATPSADPRIASTPPAGAQPAIKPKPHKHSMSLIGRFRYARKHRREASLGRRRAA